MPTLRQIIDELLTLSNTGTQQKPITVRIRRHNLIRICQLTILWHENINCFRITEYELMLVKLQAKVENDAGIEATRFVLLLGLLVCVHFRTCHLCLNKSLYSL